MAFKPSSLLLRPPYGAVGQTPNGQIKQCAVTPLPTGCDATSLPKASVPVALTVSLNCTRPGSIPVPALGK